MFTPAGSPTTYLGDRLPEELRHSVFVTEPAGNLVGRFVVEDQGSLNGTFVNRKRIDRAQLHEGDELQVGKYRLTFIA